MDPEKFEGTYINNYKLENHIKGISPCLVFQAYHLKTGKKVAIKAFIKSEIHPHFQSFIKNDFLTYRTIQNQNILRMEEYFESGIHGFLVYEFCKDSSLEDFWFKKQKFIEEKILIKIIRQIFNGFKELLMNKIYRRDYRLRNILINENKIKLGDCNNFITDGSYIFLSQKEYLSPEVLEEGNNIKDLSKAELWVIGVSIYKLVYGVSPFNGATEIVLLKNIRKKLVKEDFLKYEREDLKPKPEYKFSYLFKDLLERIFKPVEKRSIAEVFEAELLTKRFQNNDFNSFNSDLNHYLRYSSYDDNLKYVLSKNTQKLSATEPLRNIIAENEYSTSKFNTKEMSRNNDLNMLHIFDKSHEEESFLKGKSDENTTEEDTKNKEDRNNSKKKEIKFKEETKEESKSLNSKNDINDSKQQINNIPSKYVQNPSKKLNIPFLGNCICGSKDANK